MTGNSPGPVTVLGLGSMGRALAEAVVDAAHPTTVWNRSATRAGGLAERGAVVATSVGEAVEASPVVVACLLDHESVHQVLDPVVPRLAGRCLVNLTTTTPDQARELARWAAASKISYLDGAIMAVPALIGKPGSSLLYSGEVDVFERHRTLLDRWGVSSFVGPDAGRASLWDLAMLSGMYLMFAGFMHGAAMVGTDGVTASAFATRAAPFLAAMTGSLPATAEIIDAGDYSREGTQSLEFTALAHRIILQASGDQGVSGELFRPVYELVRRRIGAAGGEEGWTSVFEDIRSHDR